DESDGDDDACVEILLVTPLRYAVVIPPSGNQGRSSPFLVVLIMPLILRMVLLGTVSLLRRSRMLPIDLLSEF
ncbi:hypothetical protein Tco_0623543, partial [Tanacetum coccineum]